MSLDQEQNECKICQRQFIHNGEYDLPVCIECRESLLERPISKKVTVFITIMILLSVFMLYRLPTALNAGIQFEKGLNYSEQSMHVSALYAFEEVAEVYPESSDALAELYVSCYNNALIGQAYETLDRLIAVDPEPEVTLADRVNYITEHMEFYYVPTDEFYALSEESNDLSRDQWIDSVEQYLEESPKDIFATYILCDYYYEDDRFEDIEQILEPLVERYPDWLLGLYTIIPVKRELEKFDEASAYSEQLINLNVDNAYSYITKAKVQLKKKDDEQALQTALKSLELSPDDAHVQGTVALAYHFNNDYKNRDYYLELFDSADYVDDISYTFVHSIINGEKEWR